MEIKPEGNSNTIPKRVTSRVLGRLGLRRFLKPPVGKTVMTEGDLALEKALDELGFEPVGFFRGLIDGVGRRPQYARGGGIMVVSARGAPPSPEVVSAIRKMSEPGASLFDHLVLAENPDTPSSPQGSSLPSSPLRS